LGAFLLLFNLATNLKIITHTEYAGALDQIGTIAAQFRPNDVLLLRGGAPSYTAARDIPDNLATPLTYGFGLHAFTIKSAEPGNYATQLARYVAQWRSEGREVYLLAGASGAVGLPGFQLEAIGPARLDLNEFEQPTEQKPTNIQAYTLDMQIYRIVPNAGVAVLKAIPANDYAAEVAGLYRSEQLAGEQLAWSDGEALLRIPWPSQPTRLIVRLAAGATRPARLGAPKACIAYRPELQLWPEDPQAPAFEAPTCFTLTPEPRDYTIMIDPRSVPAPAGGSLLLRIQSDTWIPARDDPSQHDRRQLGVLFGGITIAP
jgi:hypothetical protein